MSKEINKKQKKMRDELLTEIKNFLDLINYVSVEVCETSLNGRYGQNAAIGMKNALDVWENSEKRDSLEEQFKKIGIKLRKFKESFS